MMIVLDNFFLVRMRSAVTVDGAAGILDFIRMLEMLPVRYHAGLVSAGLLRRLHAAVAGMR